jgi:hypothetical protein
LDLVLQLHGQTRAAAGMSDLVHYGWDMASVMALGTARGIDARLLSEWLPAIEAVAIANINKE